MKLRIIKFALLLIIAGCEHEFLKPARERVNLPPSIFPVDDQKVEEGKTLTVDIMSNDPDGDTLCLFADTSELGNTSRFHDERDGTGKFYLTPDYIFTRQCGSTTVRIVACDETVCDKLDGNFPEEDTPCTGSLRSETSFKIELENKSSNINTILLERFLEHS